MSDTEPFPPHANVSTEADKVADGTADEAPNLTADEQKFLVDCLTHTCGDIEVDVTAVAQARGQKNPRSISNKLRDLKKKLGLSFVARNSSGKGNLTKEKDIKSPKTATSDRIKKPQTPKKNGGIKKYLKREGTAKEEDADDEIKIFEDEDETIKAEDTV